MKRPKLWERFEQLLNKEVRLIEVSNDEWIEHFYLLTPIVQKDYILRGFYVYKDGRKAMTYKGIPVVLKQEKKKCDHEIQ